LLALVGVQAPAPQIARAFREGDQLAAGELLLLRVRLSAPAHVYLLVQRTGRDAELLWPTGAAVRKAAGEFEVADAGRALAIDPRELGDGARVLLVASPDPLDPERLRVRLQLSTRAQFADAFPGCGVDLLTVRSQAR
jgi:hypothetical protein